MILRFVLSLRWCSFVLLVCVHKVGRRPSDLLSSPAVWAGSDMTCNTSNYMPMPTAIKLAFSVKQISGFGRLPNAHLFLHHLLPERRIAGWRNYVLQPHVSDEVAIVFRTMPIAGLQQRGRQ